jgi:hypothetical protein
VPTIARSIGAPHLLEIVELSDIGLEYVDDRIAGIEQHPVAMRDAFDPGRWEACCAARARHPVGDRADVNVRASRGDDHQVGDGGFARQVDDDDILGFGVFEAFDQRLGEAPVERRRLGFESGRAASLRAGSGRLGLLIKGQWRRPLLRPADATGSLGNMSRLS